MSRPYVAIVDYSLGNLASIQQACRWAGLEARIVSGKEDVLAAEGVILPGVGAFRDAMHHLGRLDLVGPLRDMVAADRPILAICLGIQLLLDESHEFGRFPGLGIVPGAVRRLDPPPPCDATPGHPRTKVPHVGWNQLAASRPWEGTLLDGLTPGDHFYFVHSFVAVPSDESWALGHTEYGGIRFVSALARGNLFACQFHPERSGPSGLRIYRNFASQLEARR